MPLTYRLGTVFDASGAFLAPGSTYTVTVLKPGGVASATSTSNVVTLYPGHGFTVGDKIQVVGGDYSGVFVIQSTTATSITFLGGLGGAAINVSAGDTILNMGQDSGAAAPAWDGGRVIYSDPNGAVEVPNYSPVINDEGEYTYYTRTVDVWEVIHSSGTILDVVQSPFDGDRSVIRYAHEYATGGDGLARATAWTGWEEAVTGASDGDEVHFTGDFFAIQSGGVTVPSNVALVGTNRGHANSTSSGGTTIKCVSGFTGTMFTTATDSFGNRFENLLVDGSFGSNVPIATSGVVIDGCHSALVSNCNFRLFLGSAVKVTKSAGSTSPGLFRIDNCRVENAVAATGLTGYTGALHFTDGSEPSITNSYFGANNTTVTSYAESGKQCSVAFVPATAGSTGGFRMLNCGTDYAETGVYIGPGTGSGWFAISSGGGPIAGHGWYIEAGPGTLVGCGARNISGATNNTYDGFYISSTGANITLVACRADWTSGSNKHRYAFNDNGSSGGVNYFIGCTSGDAVTGAYANNHAVTKQSLWIGDRLGSAGAFRLALGTSHVGIGRAVDENIQVAFDGDTDDGTLSFRADQAAGKSRRFSFSANLTASAFHASGDPGGFASETTITNGSDVTANSTGVGQILFKGATSRDSVGFIKIYVGTTAYYIPFFAAITG